MGKHHRKWFIDEPIASNKRVEEMMDDIEEYEDERVNYQSYQKGDTMPCGGKRKKKSRK